MGKHFKRLAKSTVSLGIVIVMLMGFHVGPIQWGGLGITAHAAAYWANWATLPTAAGQTIIAGNYRVRSSVDINIDRTSQNGLVIAENATVNLYIPSGVTLRVYGAHSSGRTAGGAAIYLSSGATLVVRGEGTLYASGGNGGSGANGSSGNDGYLSKSGNGRFYGGNGGLGGSGGGGAGAGIGTDGGSGGTAGDAGEGAPEKSCYPENSTQGSSGGPGGKGGSSVAAGTLYVVDAATVTAYGGYGGGSGSGGSSGSGYHDDKSSGWENDYAAGNGGGGGGGGIYGGSGRQYRHGYGGGGGTGAGSNNSGGTGGRSDAINPEGGTVVTGGSAGSGNLAGGSGGGGKVLASTPDNVSTGGGTVSTLATYTLTYNANGGSLNQVPLSQPKYYGLTAYLSDAIPNRSGYVFRGWATSSTATTWPYAPNGAYPANTNSNATLSAGWTPLPSVAVGRSTLNERAANDGGISDTLIVNLQNGTFASTIASYLTVSGLPAGLTASVTRIDGTSLLISFTGKATHHAATNSVTNAKVSIGSGGITYPTIGSDTATAGTLTTGSFAFTFRDSAPAPNAPVFFGSDSTEGPAWADSVTLSSARLNATVNVTGAAVRERGFVYGPAGSGTPSIGNGTKVVSGSGTGSFAAGITGIAAGTTYSFRAYAITDHGTFYSQAGSLTPSALCSIGSTSVLPVREDTATIIGSVLSGGGSTITHVGVAYSLSPNPEVGPIGSALGAASSILYPSPMTGTFSIDIEGLNPNNRYYVRTFAINGSGVAYGAQVTMNTLMAGLDENTYLQSLVVDGGTMLPAFNKDVHSYMVSVPSARNNIQVTPTVAFKNATMQVTVKDQNWLKANGNPTKSGKQTTITGINASSTNVVYIEVTYQGKTRTYILNMVAQPSGSADLNSLLLKKGNSSGADINYTPAFTKDTSNYTAVVDGATEQVYVELDMGLNTFITSKINGTGTTPIEGVAKAHGTVTLTGPSTVVTIQTTSEDGKTTRTYNVLIIKQVSSSAYLSGLAAGSTSGGSNYTLSPGFDPVKANYSVAVPKNAGSQLYLTPTAAAGAVIEMSGTNAEGGALRIGEGPSYLVSGLSAGSNTVDFIVTSPDGSATAAYTVVVNVPVSDTAELSGLVVRASASGSASSGAVQTLLPTFHNTTTAYTVLVANSMASAHIAPTAAGGASYCFGDDPDYRAESSISRNKALTLPLAPGVNEVYIHAVAANGTTVNTTILTIIRAISSDARLASITGVDLQPVYGMDQGVYAATVGYGSTTLNITATANQSDATVALAVGGLAKGSAKGALTSTNVPLAVGDNTFIYTVTAQDGVTRREYTVHVVRQASSNAFLKELDFGEGGTGGLPRVITDTNQNELDGEGDPLGTPTYGASFDPDILTYYGAVDNAVETTKVKAVADDENAAVYVSIKGGAFAPLAGSTTGEIALDVGDNEVMVRVVAQDGTTVLEYTLIIVRHAATNSSLAPSDSDTPENSGLWVTSLKDPGLVQSPGDTTGFDPEHPDYTATVVPGIDETDITAKADDANAKVFIRQVGQDGTVTLASAVLGPVTASGTALATGENLFVIEVVAGDGSSQEYTLAITREEPYTGLEAEIDPGAFSFPEGLLTARSGSLVLNHTAGGSVTLTPTGEDKPIGPDSGVSYSLGSFTGDTEVLTAKPSLDEDGKTLLFEAATGVEVGKEAVLEVIIHTPNYEDVTVELSFKTSPKKSVTITVDDNAPGNTDYDGGAANKPGNSDLTIEDTDGANVTGDMDDIIYTYTGTDSKGDTYGPSSTPPTDAGDYTLTITVEDEDYAGETEIEFSIAKKALTITSATHTKPYDGTTVATGVTVVLGGVIAADTGLVLPGQVTAVYPTPDAGTATVNVTAVALTGEKSHNYTVTPANGKPVAGITKAAGLVVINPDTITFYERLKTAKYGTLNLSGIRLDAPAGVAGTPSYAAGAFSNSFGVLTATPMVNGTTLNYTAAVGKAPNLTTTLRVTITTDNFQDVTAIVTFLTIPRTPLVINAGDDGLDITYGETVNQPGPNSGLTITQDGEDRTDDFKDNITYEYSGTDSKGDTYGPSSTPPTNAGNYTLTITVEDENGHFGELEIPFTIAKADPSVNWPNSYTATYGDKLGTASLAAPANNGTGTPGTFGWAAVSGTPVGGVGNQSHSMSFTPEDTKNYNTVVKNITVAVGKATPVITWPTAGTASYGDTLADVALNGGSATHLSANVPGTFGWATPTTELTLSSGTSYGATFTPNDTANFNTVSDTVIVSVQQATGLIVTLRDPIIFIKENSSAPGTYSLASPNVMLNGPAGAPVDVTYTVPTPSEDSIFAAPGSAPAVDGSDLNYTPCGTQAIGDTASATITISSANYVTISTTVQFQVIAKDSVVISGVTPADDTYDGDPKPGYALSGDLEMTDSNGVDKTDAFTKENITYTYTGRDGTTYNSSPTPPTNAGDYTLTITVDNDDYHGEKEINFTIEKAEPQVTWPENLSATHGQTLADVSLAGKGSATQAGGFGWTTAATTPVGAVGTPAHSVTFTPTGADATNYKAVSHDVTVTVGKATPAVTWPTGLTANYGATLGSVSLAAGTAGVPGTFSWNAPDTSLAAGTASHGATFTPDDTTNYNTVQQSLPVAVAKAAGLSATITPAQLTFPEKLSTTLSGSLDLPSIIALSKTDTGAVSYTLGEVTNTSGVLAGTPQLADGTLSYTAATGVVSGSTATVKINVETANYASAQVTLTFRTVPKTHVEIEGITPENSTYDGIGKDGYTGTVIVRSGDDGQDKAAELADSTTYIYTGRDGTTYDPNTTPPIGVGSYTLTITVANDYYEGERVIEFSIGKASGLTATPAPLTVKIREAAPATEKSYDVAGALALSADDTGAVSYALNGALNGDTGILSAGPSITAAGILSYTPSSSKTTGDSAAQAVTITTDNYADITITIVFEVIAKTEVTIGLTAANGTYSSGTPTATHKGYSGTVTVADGGSNDLTDALAGSLEYSYGGTQSNGDTYGPIATPPTQPGSYALTVVVPNSNVDYTGSVTINFTVEKEAGPGAPVLSSTDATAFGNSDGTITITDYNSAQIYEISHNGGTYGDATVGEDGVVRNLPAGSYQVRVKGTDTMNPGTAADISILQPRGITVTVNKDGAGWSDHGKTLTLSDGTTDYTGTPSGAAVTFQVIADGTYLLLVDGVDTGVTATLTSSDTGKPVAVNYYTVGFSVTDGDGLSGSVIDATYGDVAISNGDVVLAGKALVVSVSGTVGTDAFVYTWSGSGTAGASGTTLRVAALGERVNANCVVSGVNAGITVSAEGLGGLRYGDAVNGKAVFTLAAQSGTFAYADTTEPPATGTDLNGDLLTYQFDPTAFTVGGLPAGLAAGQAVRVSETVVEVPVTGTLEAVGTFPLNLPASAAPTNVSGTKSAVPIIGSLSMQAEKALRQPPAVSCDDVDDIIVGIDDTMQFCTQGGTNWTTCTGSNLPDLSGDVEIWVRYAETPTHEASAPVVLVFSKRAVLGGSAAITGKPKSGRTLTADTAGITGNADPATLRYQWYKNGEAIPCKTAATYTVKSGDSGATLTCVITSTAEDGSVTTPGVTVAKAAPPKDPEDESTGDDSGGTGDDTPPPPTLPDSSQPDASTGDAGGETGGTAGDDTPPQPPLPGSSQPDASSVDEGPAQGTAGTAAPPDIPAETIRETREYNYGNGLITLTIMPYDDQHYAAGVVDTKAAIGAVLNAEEFARVAAGEHAEIQIDVRQFQQDLEVPEGDKQGIEAYIQQMAATIEGVRLGRYVDIVVRYRVGNDDWTIVTESSDDIELVIDIPEDLIFDDSVCYILRHHDGTTDLLDDLDDEPGTLTIRTGLFSTYAIVYTEAPHACWLCGFCPAPLGLCIFIWLLIAVAAAVVVYIILRNRKKREASRSENGLG